nr:PEF-CTERM sorting domain-containing protein [Methanosarcina sp. KYL-1]
MVGTASAEETVNLDYSNTIGAPNAVDVFAEYDGTQITFWVEPNTAYGATSARIDKIGLNIPIDCVQQIDITDKHGETVTVYNVLDNLPEYWTISGTNQNVDDVGSYESYFASSGSTAISVVVTLNSDCDSESLIDTNDDGFEVAAHVAWEGILVSGESSAFFAGPYDIPNGEIPEFPSIALPVASIMGIMLISGRRRKE